MATIQAELAVQEENIETQRTWLPAGHALEVLQSKRVAREQAIQVHHLSQDRAGPKSHPDAWMPAAHLEILARSFLRQTPLLIGTKSYLAVHWRRGNFIGLTDSQQPDPEIWQDPHLVASTIVIALTRFKLDKVFLATNEVAYDKLEELAHLVPYDIFVLDMSLSPRGSNVIAGASLLSQLTPSRDPTYVMSGKQKGKAKKVRVAVAFFCLSGAYTQDQHNEERTASGDVRVEVTSSVDPYITAMLDVIICSMSEVFIGNKYSEFTWLIHEQRYIRGRLDREGDLRGSINAPAYKGSVKLDIEFDRGLNYTGQLRS
ncbi:hypothetical protein CYMTET_13146 [Cymbomonas tetramitiformis]|uniref:Uncharacterized protein n=1 Tax=Cymbomonas tetramitiformis TaxID=36881 RepID=A0AAE0GJ06_9CHLO|nr:hypothetical protein CYMTET_13146 [Cymbomonas tetramitiformis]